MIKKIITIILFSFCYSLAQHADSLNIDAVQDTISIEERDSVKSKSFDVDDVIYSSSSDSLSFDVKNKKMTLIGSGELKYKDTDLKAGMIRVDFERNELFAKGIPDPEDSVKQKTIQLPLLSEGGQNYEGTSLKYNFKTQQGFISMAKNQSDKSYYKGNSVKKVNKEVFFIKDGMYTTCESDTPDTYFTASEMKVIQKDKIIARWIWMYIGGVPLPVTLPFGVFPNQSGRRSGIIAPGYGMDRNLGQYFRNFGYFFAISDYMDLALTGDYYTKGGWGTRGRYRYAKRYEFNGNLTAGYSNITLGEEGDPNRSEKIDWDLAWYHNQRFNPSTRLDVNLRFQSSNYFSNNATSYNDLLTKDIISNATFSKRWEESGTSLTLNYNRTQNLESGNITEILPNLSFSKTMSYPFRRKNSLMGKDMEWYEYIGYSYNGQFRNRRIKKDGELSIRGGIQHSIQVSASPKIGYFNISPRLSYNEKWYNKRTQKRLLPVTEDTTTTYIVVDDDIHELNAVRSFSFGLSASTKIYGMAQPEAFGIKAFRHTISPSISYSYSPDFRDDKYGYMDSYYDEFGNEIKYDKFGREIFGGAASGERQNISVSIGNLFEMKTMKDPTDTTSREEKVRLLNLSTGFSYNFAADSLNLSDLRLSYRTQIGDWINFSGALGFTFYDYAEGRRINKLLSSVNKGLLRMNSFTLSLSTNITGDKLKGESRDGSEEESEYNTFRKSDYIALYDEQPPDFTIPWNLSLSLNYNIRKNTPDEVTKSASLGMNLGFNLTKNWKFTIRGNYDLVRKQVSAPQITIFRDLHCWEMNFNWNPLGVYRGFRFEIRMKAPELRDIKVTRTKGLFTGRR